MPRNLSTQLTSALPPERLDLLRRISALATEQNLPLYLVGGFVRDLLLNRPSTDLDLVLESNAIHFARHIASILGGDLTTHDKFLTATWTLPDEPQSPASTLDFITARRETYNHPAALPDVTPSTIDDDLRRRDFTLNTLALRLDGDHFGELYDPLNGEQDLQAGLIRVLRPNSFVDDPTRIFRAVRYEQRFGFKIEPETVALIKRDVPYIQQLSGDRIRNELELIFSEKDPSICLARLQHLGAFTAIHSDFQLNDSEFTADSFASLLSHLKSDVREAIIQRLNLSAKESEFVQHIVKARTLLDQLSNPQNKGDIRPSDLHRVLSPFSLEEIERASNLRHSISSPQSLISAYLSRRTSLHRTTTGHDIEALGLPPGPKYKDILFRLECAYLDGEINTPDEERALLRQLVEQAKEK